VDTKIGQKNEETKQVSIAVDLGPQIARVAISDEVIARFKDLIARRVFVPGGKLPPERDLAAALAVSRPTLRQALRALQIMGVIRSRQGSGSYLAESAAEILREPLEFALALKGIAKTDLFETRCTLEVKLASLAATRRTEEDLVAMRDALREMKSSYGNPEAWCEHEIQFHDSIVHAARNAVMSTVMEMLSYMLMESRRQTVRMLTDYDTSYDVHEKVFVQIEKQDAEAAARAMTEHFDMMLIRAQHAQMVPADEEQSGASPELESAS
jgi:GntR family transcriptional regulator, transcriptional repressor for pyruvate dehydrogenase complex